MGGALAPPTFSMSVRPGPGATGAAPLWTGATGATGATGGLGAARLAAVLAAGRAHKAKATGPPAAPQQLAFPSMEEAEAPMEDSDGQMSPKMRGRAQSVDGGTNYGSEGTATLQKEAAEVKADQDAAEAAAAAAAAERQAAIDAGKYDFVAEEYPQMKLDLEEAIRQKRDELNKARLADEECRNKRKDAAEAVASQIETEYKKIIARLIEQLNTKNLLLNEAQSNTELDAQELSRLRELGKEIDRLKLELAQTQTDAISSESAAVAAEKAKQLLEIERLTELMAQQQQRIAEMAAAGVAKDQTREAKQLEIEELQAFIKKQLVDRKAMYEKVCKDLMRSLENANAPE